MKAERSVGISPTVSAAAAAVLVFSAMSARAATYYVSQSSGNDSWTGQAASPKGTRGPWKTLARASTDYVPGDRILLKCGDTWDEELRPKGSGTPSNPIIISSYGEGKKPIIDRQDYNQDRIGIFLHDLGGIKIVGLEFARCMTGIYAEYPDNTSTKKYVWIEDCYFRDSLKYGNYKTYPTPRNIGLGICFFSYERDKRIVLEDIMIKNCVFRRLASAVWTNSPDNFNKNASFVYNFGNMNFEDCLFEEGYQWQQGIRGVDKGSMRNCVTVDIGRGFRAWNGVAGSMFFRAKDWVFEDCEWGFVSIGLGSGDGESFDFEGNCNDMTMRDCLFHDTDGPGFLLCCYASDGHPNMGIRMENCVLNGKAKRPIGLPRCEIVNTTDWTEATWRECRFYISPGVALMRVMDPEKDKRSSFVDCLVKNLGDACSTENLAAMAKVTASSQARGNEAARAIDGDAATSWKAASSSNQWLQLDFARPTTINEFRLKEDASSSVIRYAIERWDDKASRWMNCFNGRGIGRDFIAPIVSRTTRKVRLFVIRTKGGNPCIREFEAYNDTSGRPHNVARTRGEPLSRSVKTEAAFGNMRSTKRADRAPSGKRERAEGPSAPGGMRAQYTKALAASIAEAIAGGRRPSFFSSKLRARFRITAISAAQELSLVGLRTPIKIKAQFATFSPAEMASMAVGVVRKGTPEDHARAAFFLFHAGNREDAEKHLHEAGEAGREVRSAFGS